MNRLIGELNAKGESERSVYGVLTDCDFSSWRKDLENDYTRTSQRRTGTPPYLAFELLQGTSTTHLYRHDLEFLFYIMLLVATHHTVAPTEGGPNTEPKGWVVTRGRILPFRKWFDTQHHDALSSIKESFFSSERKRPIELSPTFEAFRPWLKEMRRNFAKGFNRKNQDSTTDEELDWGGDRQGSLRTMPHPPPFRSTTKRWTGVSTIPPSSNRPAALRENPKVSLSATIPRLGSFRPPWVDTQYKPSSPPLTYGY